LAQLAKDETQPVMVRATAASLLRNYGNPQSAVALKGLAKDSEPLVRLGAAHGMGGLPPAQRWQLGAPLLHDEYRAIRLRSFEVLLLALDPEQQTTRAFRQAMAEYLDTQALQAEHPESHTNLGLLHTALGEYEEAQAAYNQALARQPDWIPALINSAELARSREDSDLEHKLLKRALQVAPDSAEVHYAKALWLTRQRVPKDAVQEFINARDLAPRNAHYWYSLGLAQLETGDTAGAIQTLETAVLSWPAVHRLRVPLVNEYTKAKDFKSALRHAQVLEKITPDDPRMTALVKSLEARLGN
jgi:tetratricopeptide (TPR) repeat protein